MADYRYLAADLVTGTIRDEIPFETVVWGRALNRAAPFTSTIAATHPKARRDLLDPARTIIYVERDGRIVGDGIPWTPQIQPADGIRTLQLHGASLWSYFSRRHIRQDLTFTNVDQLAIFRSIIAYAQAQPGGNLNIDVTDQLSGRTRTRTYEAWRRGEIDRTCTQLADVIDGFEFEATCRWDQQRDTVERWIELGYPTRGRRTNHVFEAGVNLANWGETEAGGDVANLVDAIGEGQGEDMPIATAADTSLLGAYPLLEKVVAHTSVSDRGTLVGHARTHLEQSRRAARHLKLEPRADIPPRLSTYIPGDDVEIRIDDGWIQASGRWRIDGFQVSVDTDGDETITLDVTRTEPL